MNDIAARTGVSRSTVSYVLNGRAEQIRIPDETKRKVLEAAAELGYRHNQLARSVAWGKSRMLGFLTQEPGTDVEFKSRVMVGAIEAASERGYTVQVLYLPPVVLKKEVVERCIEWRLAGIVTLALNGRVINELHREVGRHGIAMAVLEDTQSYSWAVNVSTANAEGMVQVVDHLMELGHRRIAMLAASANDAHSQWREQEFRRICRERGLEAEACPVVNGDWWNPAVNEAVSRELLERPDRPTAVFCCGDPAAAALLNVARALAIGVPGQLSVVGYGDYSFSVFTDPPLTTVSQPFHELGRLAVNRLLDRIADDDGKGEGLERMTLPESLRLRASTGPVSTG